MSFSHGQALPPPKPGNVRAPLAGTVIRHHLCCLPQASGYWHHVVAQAPNKVQTAVDASQPGQLSPAIQL